MSKYVWKDWSVYIVSYKSKDPERQPRDLSPLLTLLEDKFELTPTVCAGYNDLAGKRNMGITQKVWLTHTAALRRHARSPNAGNPCLILEDDVEFLVDAPSLDTALRGMLARRPDYKVMALGALPLGVTFHIGGGLAVSQSPVLTQSVLYSPDFVKKFVGGGNVVAAPHTGEGWHSLPFKDRLISSTLLTTQNVWPRTAKGVQNLYPSFATLHRHLFGFVVYGIPILISLFVALAIVFAVLVATQPTSRKVYIGLLVFCCVTTIVFGAVVVGQTVAVNPHHSPQWWKDLHEVAEDEAMLNDFCPILHR